MSLRLDIPYLYNYMPSIGSYLAHRLTALSEELVDLRDTIPDLKLNPNSENPGF